MMELTPKLAPRILEACRANAGDAAAAFSRALGGTIEVSIGKADTIVGGQIAEGLAGPGLAILLEVGKSALVLVLPEASGLLPAWYRTPDPTGQSKLATLAQELGTLLLPEDLAVSGFHARGVSDLPTAVARGKPGPEMGRIVLDLKSDNKGHEATLLWPLSAAGDVLAESDRHKTADHPGDVLANVRSQSPPRNEDAWERLPAYAKSLLRVSVPLRVVLAERSQSIESIVRLGAGSIIQFEKSCEEMLDVEVGAQRIAQGEVLKVGEKFGIRVTSILLPDERFRRLSAARRSLPASPPAP